ncbi:hypothetical protein K492DRAFT_171807 [Lichtheimia hyalospora FSU 10163]|nr:hypothetical protein K492DRAFT_171807 [Lichtheimia hyalospora FSU 10163]
MSPAATSNLIPVGDLHCQRHPYDKELTTTCISCSENLTRRDSTRSSCSQPCLSTVVSRDPE